MAKIHINSVINRAVAQSAVTNLLCDGSYEVIIRKLPKSRTSAQNRALHKYFGLLAQELNEGGWSVQEVLKNAVAREWTAEGIKEHLWRPIQVVMFDIESTANLERGQLTSVYEVLNRHTSTLFGVGMQFPSGGNL